ncbi:MAG TPA: thioredoxin family protein, partial [Ligilactobacillus aviarius]|nr:thioredoxin family protein [Ligilactobacillus aviarius]
KVDVGQYRELAEQFGIQNIPTQILFVNGQAKEKITGYRPLKPFEDYLRQKIDQYLN